MSNFTQDFFTSRRNYSDGNTRIGEKGRLWYDSITNTIRIGDGITPGGILISGGSGSAPNLTGGSVNQILVKKSNTDYDYQWEELIVDPIYTKLLDDTEANTLYLGEAQPNNIESAAVWRIQKIVFDASGNVDSVRFAASGLFDQIWDNRTSLIYV